MNCDWCQRGPLSRPTFDGSSFPPHFTAKQIIELQLLQDHRDPQLETRYNVLDPSGERFHYLQQLYLPWIRELQAFRFETYQNDLALFQESEQRRMQACMTFHLCDNQIRNPFNQGVNEQRNVEHNVQNNDIQFENNQPQQTNQEDKSIDPYELDSIPIQRMPNEPQDENWMQQEPMRLQQSIVVQQPNGEKILYKGDDTMDYARAANFVCYLGSQWKGKKLRDIMTSPDGRSFLHWWYKKPEDPKYKQDGPKRAQFRKAIEYVFQEYYEHIKQYASTS